MRIQLFILTALILADVLFCSELANGEPLKVQVSSDARRQGRASDAALTDVESTSGAADALEQRKVWSRWSKWGVCSVTCGTGSVARRRLCVAGRCAPGEREEQRRPCARTPCFDTANVTAPDDGTQ